MFCQALLPKAEGVFGHGERRDGQLPGADAAAHGAGPGKERHDRSRMSPPVPVIEVIGRWVVVIDGQLHQPQSKDARVEVHVLLRVTGDRGHMMQSENIWHSSS